MKLSRYTLAFALAMGTLGLANLSFGEVIDTFNRADNDTLGKTEGGGYAYVETTTSGRPGNVAQIKDNQLLITGAGKSPIGRVYLKGFDAADVTVSFKAEFKTDKAAPESGDTAKNSLGVMLRTRETANFGQGTSGDADTGYVAIEFFNNGELFIRERQADGKLITLLRPASFTYDKSLGATRNGKPYDADNNGMLGTGEPFEFSVTLVGKALTVSANGEKLTTVGTKLTNGAENGIGIFKGRPSGKFTLASDLLIDDLAVSSAGASVKK